MNALKDFWRARPTWTEAGWLLIGGAVATVFVAPLLVKAIGKAKGAVSS